MLSDCPLFCLPTTLCMVLPDCSISPPLCLRIRRKDVSSFVVALRISSRFSIFLSVTHHSVGAYPSISLFGNISERIRVYLHLFPRTPSFFSKEEVSILALNFVRIKISSFHTSTFIFLLAFHFRLHCPEEISHDLLVENARSLFPQDVF